MQYRKITGIKNYVPEIVKRQSLEGLAIAIKICGGHDKFIHDLNIYAQLIAGWKKGLYGVDPRYVIAIERLTNGIVKRSHLRMDIFQD